MDVDAVSEVNAKFGTFYDACFTFFAAFLGNFDLDLFTPLPPK